MHHGRLRSLIKRFVALVIVFLPIGLLYLIGGLEFLERRWMDVQFRLTQRPAKSEVVLVDIDPRSLNMLPEWPWPRGHHARVLEALIDAGAARVGFDIDFSSKSDADEDDAFAQAIEAAEGRVVLPVFHRWQYHGPQRPELVAVEPLPKFKEHATLGSIYVQPETDGLVRRYQNHGEIDGKGFVSFAAALAGNRRPDIETFYVDFGVAAESVDRISYVDVLTGQFEQERFAGKVVIVGASAVELDDLVAVPISAALPGPLFEALAFESQTQSRALRRAGPALTLGVAFLLVLLLAPRFQLSSWRHGLFLTLGCSAVVLYTAVAVQYFKPFILDATPWILVFIGLYGQALVRRIDQQDVGLVEQSAKIRRTEGLMRHVVENSFDAIITVDNNGTVETFNRAAQRMFRCSEVDVTGSPITELFDCPGFEARSVFARAAGSPVEVTARCQDGRTFPVELVVTGIRTEDESKFVAFLRDITERKAQQAALEHQATHDPLTDLPNRVLLHTRIQQALKAARSDGRQVAILLLDLNRFKEINDILGHPTGDQLLQQVARRLHCPLAAGDTIARLGGDEFAVLLPCTDLSEACEVGWSMVEALKSPFLVDGFLLQIDTSLGVAMFPEHGDDVQTLIQHADVAMYVAKHKRSRLAVYCPDQDFNDIRNLTLQGDLRHAIENDQLTLAYQPKIRVETGQICGVEALLRWRHPQHGDIPPDEFITLAEHSGLIGPLTEWVCKTALSQVTSWSRVGLDLNVSINLSARNLLEQNLPASVARVLSETGLAAERLTLEITESVLMDDPDRALDVVTRLQALGCGISIDDFGTGYSSLGYLAKLPAQELKIDKSFVMQMERDAGNATIVQSTIDLAHNLGLRVVAEGVESETVWGRLKQLGCDFGQGYHLSCPLSPDALEAWIRERLITDRELVAALLDNRNPNETLWLELSATPWLAGVPAPSAHAENAQLRPG